jgi:hypothetical protein
MRRQVTHTEHQKDYDAGYDATKEEIASMGLDATADKWRAENPNGVNPKSLGAYYYANGGLDAIVSLR